MAKELPYLPSYKNVGKLFEKIASAKIPEALTTKYLYDILGLKSVGDRALISLLKALGFIDNSGRPSPEYSKLKNPSLAKQAIGSAIKIAYAPLFASNENAHTLSAADLKGLIAQVAGSDTDQTTKIAGTLNNLIKIADFTKTNKKENEEVEEDEEEDNDDSGKGKNGSEQKNDKGKNKRQMHPEFHYNIQIHLPTNGSEETYLNIFNAIRKSFQ